MGGREREREGEREQFGGKETGWKERGREGERARGREREVGRPMCNISPLPPSIHGATMPDQIWDPTEDALSE